MNIKVAYDNNGEVMLCSCYGCGGVDDVMMGAWKSACRVAYDKKVCRDCGKRYCRGNNKNGECRKKWGDWKALV